MNDAAFLLRLRARVREKEALAADDGSFDHQQAAAFAGIDCVDLFVERLLIETGAVDEHGNDVRMTQAFALVRGGSRVDRIGRIVGRGGAFARPFLLRLL